MTLEKEKYINKLNSADLTHEGWEWDVIKSIQCDYARGYITCLVEMTSSSHYMIEEEKRDDMLEYAEYSIWE